MRDASHRRPACARGQQYFKRRLKKAASVRSIVNRAEENLFFLLILRARGDNFLSNMRRDDFVVLNLEVERPPTAGH